MFRLCEKHAFLVFVEIYAWLDSSSKTVVMVRQKAAECWDMSVLQQSEHLP